FFIERDNTLELILELQREPLWSEVSPQGGKALQGFSIGLKQPAVIPKRRLFLSPKPKQTVIGGDRVDSIPKYRPHLLRQGKVGVGFAVDSSLALGDLETDGADDFAIRAFGHLEFGDAFGQVFNRELHRSPKSGERPNVVKRGAAHTVVRGTHRVGI